VPLDGESSGRKPGQVARAGVHVENAVAVVALEVVMVLVRGCLIARAIPGQIDRGDLAGVKQQLQVPVHGREGQRRYVGLRRLQHLLR
jgi:hypothetical protein